MASSDEGNLQDQLQRCFATLQRIVSNVSSPAPGTGGTGSSAPAPGPAPALAYVAGNHDQSASCKL